MEHITHDPPASTGGTATTPGLMPFSKPVWLQNQTAANRKKKKKKEFHEQEQIFPLFSKFCVDGHIIFYN